MALFDHVFVAPFDHVFVFGRYFSVIFELRGNNDWLFQVVIESGLRPVYDVLELDRSGRWVCTVRDVWKGFRYALLSSF